MGTIAHPINDSKGCGGVMRVAPIGLYFEEDRLPIDRIDLLGAKAAAITHGHELGYIPAAMLVHIVHRLTHCEGMSVLDAVLDAKETMLRLFREKRHLPTLITLTDRAVELAAQPGIDELDAIHELGEGWVAEETLAIAVYCALKYENDFEKAIVASVNHKGDSDSTGAVTGNILGAKLGMGGIPEKFLTALELKETILEIADDLFSDCRISEYSEETDEVWERKYISHTYPN